MSKIAKAQAAANKAYAIAGSPEEAYNAYREVFDEEMRNSRYSLTVYEGGTISLQFTGKSKDEVSDALRRWMNTYNGEGEHPQRVDGLTCRDCPDDVVLRWDEDYGKWCIWWDNETPRYFGWSRARAAFIDACLVKVLRIDNPCQDCKSDCRISFPACEAANV